mmetsp:Transcript_17654/g.29019  ORF Transcript_17654/g.29019 Transcript_17654/m.29019 type:complete len:955 (+) Transcript_17654:92-2956(+)
MSFAAAFVASPRSDVSVHASSRDVKSAYLVRQVCNPVRPTTTCDLTDLALRKTWDNRITFRGTLISVPKTLNVFIHRSKARTSVWTVRPQCSSVQGPQALKRPELLAPAGNWECAKAAVENGADAIYFGLDKFNARMRAENFTEADLPDLMEFLHRRGVKGYVTINTLIFTKELPEIEKYLRTIIASGVDAAIVQDLGLCRLIRHLSPDFPIHGSTQMTVTSSAGVQFARAVGCNLVVLARECSLKDIGQIKQASHDFPLEVFVHGALCVAYSGQCLTSEALGGRSANRGECAQACRMQYDLIVDGKQVDLGDQRYLLSPQDLAGVEVLPELVQSGVSSLKIEGRLKSPEYVANVVRVYRSALDSVMSSMLESPEKPTKASNKNGRQSMKSVISDDQRYELEMVFSRGLYTGWFNGIDNKALVHGRYGKKRGFFLGRVSYVARDHVVVQLDEDKSLKDGSAVLKAGDGVVFDCGRPDKDEEGGRVYEVKDDDASSRKGFIRVFFGRQSVDMKRVHIGDLVWKTSDTELDRRIRQSYAGEAPKFKRAIDMEASGDLGLPLTVTARDSEGHFVVAMSEVPLQAARDQPLTAERLREQLGRLGNTQFSLRDLVVTDLEISTGLMLPISELNRVRRAVIQSLDDQLSAPLPWGLNSDASVNDLLTSSVPSNDSECTLIPLVRSIDQLEAVLSMRGIRTVYVEMEDPRAYGPMVERARDLRGGDLNVVVAPPRITKPSENWILEQVLRSGADGYLIRNYDQLSFFKDHRCIGDFSLNVANPITADLLLTNHNLERVTASYDLNASQLDDLLHSVNDPSRIEVTIHQHMPLFHMEHCVFCMTLSEGTDYTNCGRPCDTYDVRLRDRTGMEHVLQADAGCRNTLFNGTAQTGAESINRLVGAGAKTFRVEFLKDDATSVKQTLDAYQSLLSGEITGTQLWRRLRVQNQLGVTRGSMSLQHV